MTKPPLEFDHIHIIAENPHNTAAWYVEMLGAEITADTVARGARRFLWMWAARLSSFAVVGRARTPHPPNRSGNTAISPVTTNGARIKL